MRASHPWVSRDDGKSWSEEETDSWLEEKEEEEEEREEEEKEEESRMWFPRVTIAK